MQDLFYFIAKSSYAALFHFVSGTRTRIPKNKLNRKNPDPADLNRAMEGGKQPGGKQPGGKMRAAKCGRQNAAGTDHRPSGFFVRKLNYTPGLKLSFSLTERLNTGFSGVLSRLSAQK